MKDDLHRRLGILARRIDDARASLKARNRWHEGHDLTAGELEARYSFLQAQLGREISDLEAHGHRVSALEHSVREWIDGLEL